MPKRLLALIAGIAVIPTALACLCPSGTDYWWQKSRNVLLVRVDSVTSGYERVTSRKRCMPAETLCWQKQIARFTVVETIKGSSKGITSLASGYGGGDCGIALVAGGFYVVFLQANESQIGICNAAGPYVMRDPAEGSYPKRIDNFVKSLRRAAKTPKTVIAPRPTPQSLGLVK